jgi:hypothetical protein
VAHFWISMYADDAVIFVKPNRSDINNLALILNNFGEVTGLKTNLLKTSVTPIMSHPIYKNINRAIIYAPGSSHAYIQQNYQDITTRISK